MRPVIALMVVGMSVCLSLPAVAQSDMPVIPPPSQRQPAPAPGQPPQTAPQRPGTPTVSMEDLVRQGYEVRAMEAFGGQAGRFVVLLQRSGEVRSCLLSIEARAGTTPLRRSACF